MKLIARSHHPATVLCSASSLILLVSAVLVMSSIMCGADPSPLESNSLFGGVDEKNLNDKRPFFVGSRYGRSHVYGGKDLRQVNVVPRNDRFFLGSRYGKRSDTLTKEIETDNNNGAELTYLACLHTGVSNLYRCYGKERDQQYNEDLDSSSP
ncbi:AAEL011702-PA [Aedes aegypti]|uniref:AAEL011702-PA n=2 Tax=Aedes aegypti TaxID=7159 RepID=A0A1S4FTY4_AEDAE|nr:RYamide neuropeptides [Aedes aegypti]EAT36199.1 AAEL011702-PA [Aedes aegypti]